MCQVLKAPVGQWPRQFFARRSTVTDMPVARNTLQPRTYSPNNGSDQESFARRAAWDKALKQVALVASVQFFLSTCRRSYAITDCPSVCHMHKPVGGMTIDGRLLCNELGLWFGSVI